MDDEAVNLCVYLIKLKQVGDRLGNACVGLLIARFLRCEGWMLVESSAFRCRLFLDLRYR